MGIAAGILNAYPQTYEEYVDKVIVGKDGVNNSSGKDREYYLQHEPTRNFYEKELKRRQGQSYAAKLQGDGNAFYNATTGFGNAVAEIPAFFGSLVPNDLPGEALDNVFTFQNIYNKLKGEYRIDKEFAQKELGRDLTEKDLEAIQNYIEDKGIAPSIGYSAGVASDILLGSKGLGSAKEVGTKISSKAGDVASDLKYGDIGFTATRGKLPEATSLGAAATRETKRKKIIDELTSNPELPNETIGKKAGVSGRTINEYRKQLGFLPAQRNLSSFTAKSQATKKLIEDAARANPELNTSQIAELTGISSTRVSDILRPGAIKPGEAKQSVEGLINFNLSRDANVEAILKAQPRSRRGNMSKDRVNRFVTEIMNEKLQDSVEGYKKTYMNMLEDRSFMPSKDYFNPLKNKVPEGSSKKSVTAETKNIKIARKELADELGYSVPELSRLTNAASKNRQKIRSKEEARAQGPEALARWYQKNYGSPKLKRRETEAGAISVTDNEKLIRNELFDTRKIENMTIKDNSIFANKNIFDNPRFMDMLSIYVDPQTGSILRIDPTKKIEKLIKDNKFWQADHILGLEHGSKMSAVPANLQMIPGLLNVAFKRNAEIFISKNKNNPEIADKIRALVDKAKELRITLKPKGMGRLGYKQPAVEQGKHAERLNDQLDFYYGNIERKDFAEGSRKEDDPSSEIYTGLDFGFGSIREVQNLIKEKYEDSTLPEKINEVRKPIEITAGDVLERTREVVNKGDRPIEFRPLSEGYKLITDNPIVEAAIASPFTLNNALLDLTGSLYNAATGNNVDMREKFPATYRIQEYLTNGAGKTPDGQTYISFIDEINRAQETGFARLSYNLLDLAASVPDLAVGTEFSQAVKESYDRADKEELFSKPETFLGEIGAIATEFGVPGTQAFKFINFLRRGLKSRGLNTFVQSTYGLTGATKNLTRVSNVAKRVGTGAALFGLTDFVAGGPYNTVSQEYAEDPLMLDNTLGYDYENTEGLSGRDLTIANFKNRLRFGAEGAMIGASFPLIGPPLWAATKYGVLKPGAAAVGLGSKIVDNLAIKPISYLSANFPVVKQTGQVGAAGISKGAGLLGKDILARAAVATMGSPTLRQLPDFKDWRMFDVLESDPLKANLKKIDNVFAFFRDSSKKSPNQFFVETKAQQLIKGKSREIEKYLDSIERKAYDLAKGFQGRYNTNKTSPAGEEYLLDQVLAVIKGQLDINKLPVELQSMTKQLSKTFDDIRRDFAEVLPDDSGLKSFLNTNLKSYVRQSFASFTNPQYRPEKQIYEQAVEFVSDIVRKNENLLEIAQSNAGVSTAQGVKRYAEKITDEILRVGKTEGRDPIEQLKYIAKNKLQDRDLYETIKTGEELPAVIKQLLGEENNLRSSVMQTTASLVTQTANVKSFNRIADILLKEGRLFKSQPEADAIVKNSMNVARVPGLGMLDSKINQMWGSPEVVRALQSTAGPLDKLMESEIIQGLVAYKAGVQTSKTVLSPATQSRNFGSAAAFVLNNGWIGGRASVTDAFKITMDDIFGAGRTVDEEQLIKNIGRKVELGVIDENIVASELSAVLADIKKGKIGTFGKLAEKADNLKFMKTATRLYSGGDNIWKWYSHEYLKSYLRGSFKNIDEIKKAVKDDFGITEFNPKNIDDGVEEYSALLVRELMPTYSKVPPAIQAIRKIPFVGNFVSFPAEILRTSVATSSLALKHIASDNSSLRSMGYRSLLGQALTLYALNEGARGLGYAMTDVTPNMIQSYKDYFGPEYMKYSDLIPISNVDPKTGAFKVFDMSRYNPYDIVTATASTLLRNAFDPKAKLDPEKINTDVFRSYLEAVGPLYDLFAGTFFGISIGVEGVLEAYDGVTKSGSRVWSKSDLTPDMFDKAIMHILNKIEPGAFSSLQKVYGAIAGDVDSLGQPLDISDELFKLSGGSTVTVNVPKSFSYKISEFQNTFKDARVSEDFYTPKNYQNRGPAQLVREFNQQNEEAFRQQYEFYAAVRQALDSGLMKRSQIRKALQDRKISAPVIENILKGKFTALSLGEGGLEGRYKKIKEGNPGKIFRKNDFIPTSSLERAKRAWERKRFKDFELNEFKSEKPKAPIFTPKLETSKADVPVAPLPQTPAPLASPTQTASAANPITGLTTTETALLDRDEQLIRQRQRGTV